MIEGDLIPTDNTWRLLLWSAVNDPATAEAIWKRGVAQEGDHYWSPSVKSLRALLASFQAADDNARIVNIFHGIGQERDDEMGLGRLNLSDLESSRTVMIIFRKACKVHESRNNTVPLRSGFEGHQEGVTPNG